MAAFDPREYANFDPDLYKQVANARSLFQDEFTLLSCVLSETGLGRGARILDAACGTGDVLRLLSGEHYQNLYGTDGCEAMVDMARRSCPGLADHITVCLWKDLRDYFAGRAGFECIYFLGHALPHADKGDVPGILSTASRALNPGGLLLFDMRNWTRQPDGSLAEEHHGRTQGAFRLLGQFDCASGSWFVEDCCTYDRCASDPSQDRQKVAYYRRRAAPDGADSPREKFAGLSYALFDHVEAERWLLAAGFQARNIKLERRPGWPYLVVIARKCSE